MFNLAYSMLYAASELNANRPRCPCSRENRVGRLSATCLEGIHCELVLPLHTRDEFELNVAALVVAEGYQRPAVTRFYSCMARGEVIVEVPCRR